LLQNNSEYSTAIKPVSSRMIPRMLTLMPGVVASTAKARMAPSTIRKMPTPMLIFHRPSRCRWDVYLLVGHAPRCKTPNRSSALRTNLASLPTGPVQATCDACTHRVDDLGKIAGRW